MTRKPILKIVVTTFVFLIMSALAFASQPVEVTRDDKGVWYITGPDNASRYDVFEAMGYSVATDRLWQMELYRRTATGRMAEIFGSFNDGGFIQTDIFMRTIGYSEEELDNAFNGMDPEVQDVILGYVDGVNRRIADISANPALLPFEFARMEFAPEPWTTNQVLAWTALMQRNFDPEALDTGQLDNVGLLGRLSYLFGEETGFEMFNDLRWTNDPAAPSVIDHKRGRRHSNAFPHHLVPAPQVLNFVFKLKERREKIMKSLEKVNAKVKMGSYAWVVSGEKTKSGNPILYSGPQMGFSVPSIVTEGAINAGGLNISGMTVPGVPGIIIGRTPHHAWSMQVGHAHTTDYYFDSPENVAFHRMETIKVKDGSDIPLPVFRSSHGPVINPLPYTPETYDAAVQGPIVSWKYSHWGYELDSLRGFLQLAQAQDMKQFGQGLKDLGVSQHFCYADQKGNIAYWMSGRDPVRPEGEWRLPQGALSGIYNEWDIENVRSLSHDRNTKRGWYSGWNNKTSADYASGFNGIYTIYGPFHRTHVLYDYFDSKLRGNRKLGFEEIRDLALNIATTDSFYGGGNPWKYVKKDFSLAIFKDGWNPDRFKALYLLSRWDGHFVKGGEDQWAEGTERAEAWVLMDRWIEEVIRLTFSDELAVVDNGELKLEENSRVLFNVLLHGLGYPGSLKNNYDWFRNLAEPSAPQDADAIILAALDNVLAQWDGLPSTTFERGYINYTHDLIGPMWSTPKSSRSTYAHCVEFGRKGPVRIESMFPLGESGHLWLNPVNPLSPVPDDHFFSMTEEFDTFQPRTFPLFE